MPRNTLAPGFIKIEQITTIGTLALSHVQSLGIIPVSWSGVTTTIERRSGVAYLWTAAVASLMVVLKPLFTDDTSWVGAELWRQDLPGDDPIFVASLAMTDVGSVAGTAISACQAVFSFKGADDSSLRFTLQEPTIAADLKHAYAALTAARKALVDYIMTGSDGWIHTRGNSLPASFQFMVTKTNDKTRKQRMGL